MYFSYVVCLAAASVQAASLSRSGATLQARDEFTSVSSSSYSFSRVTKTYETVSTQFSDARETLETQESMEGAVSVLSDFRRNLLDVVSQYERGCDCEANAQDGSEFNEMVRNWFLELETMVEMVQQRWPDQYSQSCSGIFSQIGVGLQTALAVAYDAGLDVTSFVSGLNLNHELLSTVSIQTQTITSFTSSITTTSTYGHSFAPASPTVVTLKGRPLRHHAHLVKVLTPIVPLRGAGADRTLKRIGASFTGKTVAPHAPDSTKSHNLNVQDTFVHTHKTPTTVNPSLQDDHVSIPAKTPPVLHGHKPDTHVDNLVPTMLSGHKPDAHDDTLVKTPTALPSHKSDTHDDILVPTALHGTKTNKSDSTKGDKHEVNHR